MREKQRETERERDEERSWSESSTSKGEEQIIVLMTKSIFNFPTQPQTWKVSTLNPNYAGDPSIFVSDCCLASGARYSCHPQSHKIDPPRHFSETTLCFMSVRRRIEPFLQLHLCVSSQFAGANTV